ncbi:ribosomal protein S18-alanine N-acetyltransferase [Enterococcus olivae]
MTMIKSKHFYQTHDLAAALYACAATSYTHGSPWSLEQFIEDLHNPQSEYLLLEKDGIAGFLGYHQIFDEIEIFNIVVSAKEKNQGYGRYLLKELFRVAKEEQATQILLEVRVSNLSAQKLYLSHGFEVVARRKNYYQAPVEDALIMIKKVRPDLIK